MTSKHASFVLRLITVASCSFAVGCVGRVVLLKDTQGHLAECRVGAGETYLTGVIIRDMSINQCVQQYESAGYWRVDGKGSAPARYVPPPAAIERQQQKPPRAWNVPPGYD